MDERNISSRFENIDCIQGLRSLPDESVHAIISDIPYGIGADDWDVLHSNTNSAYLGASPAQKKAQATFARRGKPINGWSDADRQIPKEYQAWCAAWSDEWFRVIKPGGSVLVFAGRRLAHRCIGALEDSGFSMKDQIAWVKPTAPHRAQRVSVVFERRGNLKAAEEWAGWRLGNLRPRFEPITWMVKPYKIGTTIADNVLSHEVGAYDPSSLAGSISSDTSNILTPGVEQSESKIHPTQKPLGLMTSLVSLVTKPGQLVLDPFAGSATTLVAAANLGRRYVGYEIDSEYYALAQERLSSIPPTLFAEDASA